MAISGIKLYFKLAKYLGVLALNFFAYYGITLLLNFPEDVVFFLGLFAGLALVVFDIVFVARQIVALVKFFTKGEEVTNEKS